MCVNGELNMGLGQLTQDPSGGFNQTNVPNAGTAFPDYNWDYLSKNYTYRVCPSCGYCPTCGRGRQPYGPTW